MDTRGEDAYDKWAEVARESREEPAYFNGVPAPFVWHIAHGRVLDLAAEREGVSPGWAVSPGGFADA